MADETRKIVHLVGTSAQGAAGGGRKGLLMHDTDAATLRMQLDAGGSYAFYARRDAAQTFTGVQTFQNGVVAATAKVNNLTQGRVVTVGANGQLIDDAGLTRTQTSGITDALTIGDGSVGAPKLRLNRASAAIGIHFLLAGNNDWWSGVESDGNWYLDDYFGGAWDAVIKVEKGAGGLITLGGSAATKRDVNLTGNLKLSGTQRISNAGRFDASSLYNSAWAGGGVRMLATDNVGMGYAMDAATARATIGAAQTSHTHTFASLTSKPTTLTGYGIMDAQPLDSDLTAIAGLSTQPFGRSLLTRADAAAVRTAIGVKNTAEAVSVTKAYADLPSPAGYALLNDSAFPVIPANALTDGTVIRLKAGANFSVPDYADLLFGLSTNSGVGTPTLQTGFSIGVEGGPLPNFTSGKVLISCEMYIGAVTSGSTRRVHFVISATDVATNTTYTRFDDNRSIDTSIALYPHIAIDLASSGSVTRYFCTSVRETL